MNADAAAWCEVVAEGGDDPDSRPYQPHGAALELMRCRSEEVLLEGPAGTGKTRAVLEKVYLVAEKYPGAQLLLARAKRASMNNTVLRTWEEKVVPVAHRCLLGPTRPHRDSYAFPNGSRVIPVGLDFPERIMSLEVDMVALFEGTEATENQWEMALTRLRNGVLPYQQGIVDVNPAEPSHWLNRRAETDTMVRLLSRHADNPAVADEYLEKLRRLTGHRRGRLYEGNWVGAEGRIYSFARGSHVACRPDFPTKRVVVGVDDGNDNPFAAGRWLVDKDQRMHLERGVYRSGMRIASKVQAIVELGGLEDVEAVVVDPSAAQLRQELLNAGLPVVKGRNDVIGGLEMVQELMAATTEEGKPRMTVDPSQAEWIRECEGYSWAKNRDGTAKDQPTKREDHHMDQTRYAAMYVGRSQELRLWSV